MGKRDNDVANGGEVGLRGFPALGAGGTVAHVTNCKLAGKRVDIGVGEHMAHQTKVLTHHHRAAVAGSDTG